MYINLNGLMNHNYPPLSPPPPNHQPTPASLLNDNHFLKLRFDVVGGFTAAPKLGVVGASFKIALRNSQLKSYIKVKQRYPWNIVRHYITRAQNQFTLCAYWWLPRHSLKNSKVQFAPSSETSCYSVGWIHRRRIFTKFYFRDGISCFKTYWEHLLKKLLALNQLI